MPPLLVATVLGVVAASYTSSWLNRRRLARYFINPPLVFIAMAVLYTVIIGTVFVGI